MSHRDGGTVALICARAGSKGVPGKNIRLLAGRPLLAWTVTQALDTPGIDRVIVSTDSDEIAAVARQAGAETPFLRPAELAQDDSPEWLVWRHAITQLTEQDGAPGRLVVLPVTSPLRAVADIERAIAAHEEGDVDIVVCTTAAHRSPYFNMVREREDGTVELVIAPHGTIWRRQDAPQVYDMTTVAYVTSPGFVRTRDALFEGRVRAVHVPQERAIDIDTPLDFRIAELLMQDRMRAGGG